MRIYNSRWDSIGSTSPLRHVYEFCSEYSWENGVLPGCLDWRCHSRSMSNAFTGHNSVVSALRERVTPFFSLSVLEGLIRIDRASP